MEAEDTMTTPKPDPIILNNAEPIVPNTVAPTTPITPTINTSTVSMSNKDKIKEFIRKNKKLVIALSILGIALLIAIILIIFSYKPAGTIKNDQSTVSAPISEKIKPIVLSKECKAENQDIKAMVPADWTCGTTTEVNKDLTITNGDITIRFPKDVQGSIGCGTNTTTCKTEIIYNSSKVNNLTSSIEQGKIEVITGTIKIGDKTFLVNVNLKDPNQTELTADQKALILNILENIEATPASTETTKTLSFTVDPAMGKVSGTKSLVAKIVVDKDTVLVQKSAAAASIASNGSTALVIASVSEWNTEFFQKAEFVGSLPSIGNAYRATLGVEGSTQIYYVPAANLKLGADKCTGISSPTGYYNAPCGEIPLDSGYYFLCASTNGTVDLNFCDTIMQNLTFTLKDN